MVASSTRIRPMMAPCGASYYYFVAMIAFNVLATALFLKHTLPFVVPNVVEDDPYDDTVVPKIHLNKTTTATRIRTTTNTVVDDPSYYYDHHHHHKTIEDIISEIITKWNISTDSNKERRLLEQIWNRDNTYDPSTDLIVFYHPMKSGGTSLSQVLSLLGGVVPGSDESGYFHFDKFKKVFEQQVIPGNVSSKEQWWSSQRVLYSHSVYRGYGQRAATTSKKRNQRLASYLHDNNETSVDHPNTLKRIRHITMIRDPMAFVSSNYAEWFCQLGKWERQAIRYGIKPTGALSSSSSSSCDYTLEDRTKARIIHTREGCQNLTKSEFNALRNRAKEHCIAYQNGQTDPTPECASISAFLSSPKFHRFFTNVYKDQTKYDDDDGPNNTTTAEDYIHGALEFFGGLDTTTTKTTTADEASTISISTSEQTEEDKIMMGDMMWFGITDRMLESMCLFHYQTGLPYVPTPSARFKQCRPTTFWSNEDMANYRNQQVLDHSVYHAANAILDLRLIKMRQDLWSRLLALLLPQQQHHHQHHHYQQQDERNWTMNDSIFMDILNQTLVDSMPFTSLECLGPRPSVLDMISS